MRPLAFDLEPARSIVAALVLVLAMSAPGCEPAASSGPTQAADRNAKDAEPTASTPAVPDLALDRINLPLARLVDQDGQPVSSVRDLIGSRVAAIQFVFTRCATTCPILAGQFEGVRARLGDAMGRDFLLISVTVDPEYDRPETLKDWGRRHGARPGWSLLTGSQAEVDRLLAGLGVAAADPKNHQSRVLVVDGVTSRGLWTSGLASPDELVPILRRVRSARPSVPTGEREAESATPPASSTEQDEAAERYFTNAPLVDHSGRPRRFYRDLLRGKVVVINVFFSQCNGSCVAMGNTLAKLQERLGDRLERDVRLISITVDSPRDTVDVLSAYARRYGAREGWYFLGGAKPDVDALLKKLGQYVETREAHGAILLVGNLQTGLWKKVFGLADAEQVIDQVQSVIDDKGTG